jgi:hypothetical protein
LLGDFNAKVGKKNSFIATIRNGSLHDVTNDNGVRVVNFATSKNLSKMQYSHIVTFINILGHNLRQILAFELTIF